jgi:glycosyltransferase EpsJ
LCQSYTDIELVIVDDGSDSGTYDFIESLKKKDGRVITVHTENKGVSAARNAGIGVARGEYIFFSDSDDYADPAMISEMVVNAQRNNADLVIAGYYFEIKGVGENRGIEQRNRGLYLCGSEELKDHMVELWDNSMMYNVWNKLFRTPIIKENNIRFPEGKAFNEDRDFIRDYLYRTESCVVMDRCFYHYLREDSAAATGVYRRNMLDIRKEEYHRLLEFFDKFGITGYREYASREHLDRVIATMENLFNSSLDGKQRKKEIARILRDEDTRECMRNARPKSKKAKVLYGAVRTGNVTIVYHLIGFIHMVRSKSPILFYRLKQSR